MDYFQLCVILLKDNGSIAQSLQKEYCKNAVDINHCIFTKWLEGGSSPVSWATLIDVLEHMELKELARKIKLYVETKKSI